MKRIVLIGLMVCSLCNAAREEVGVVREGNFALPTSQQPSPLFAFGQNIVEAHDVLANMSVYYRLGSHKKFVDIFPAILYGVSDKLSLYFNIPFTPKYQLNQQKSSGIEDIFIQAEYLFYNNVRQRNATSATVVGALFLPTGSAKKNPPTGVGSPSFLLGTTLSYTSVDWYCFVSPFAFLTTKNSGTKFGNIVFYQGGLGRNLVGNPDGWIVTPMLELYGVYSQRDRVNGVVDTNSGGNIVYVGPCVWTSTKRFIGQAGLLFAATQQLNGCQNTNRYIFSVAFGWKFNS